VEASGGGLTEHAARNRKAWDSYAVDFVEPGERAWASMEPTWGIWSVAECDLDALPEVAGKDVVELGCGTAYWSAWLMRRGARVVGIDNSAKQLETALRLQREHGLEFPLIHASAEAVPLPSRSFDVALSEYGASIWCDPHLWIPEAARLLRPGGHLVFLTNSVIAMLTAPDSGPSTDRLVRDQFGMNRFEFPGEASVEFHLPHGELIDVLATNGFALERLIELQAPEHGDPGPWDYVTLEWARRWPSEEIWRSRRL